VRRIAITTGMEEKRNSEIRRLLLAKTLYLHGCTHASRKDNVSRMLAIHHFDNTVEMVLKCVATKKGIRPERKHFYFGELLGKIDGLPLEEQMKGLHEVRNIVQHQGDIPSLESVIKYKSYVEDFFKKVCREIFNVAYEELFLSTLIEDENLRKQAMKAEEAFGKEEFKLCIELCDDALMSATFEEADVFHSAGMLTGYWGASEELRMVLSKDYLEKYREKDYYELARELRGAILQWGQATTGMQFLDEYRMDFLKHRQIVKISEDLSDEELKDNAEFSLNFVTGLILKWQEEGMLV
jgi:hypothetical protein